MATTRDFLKTQIDYKRRDNTTSFASDDEIYSYINECGRWLMSQYDWEWARTSANFSYVTGSYVYALSTFGGFKSPIDLFYSTDYDFDYLSPEDFMRLSGDHSNIYSVESDKFYCDTSFGSGSLVFDYYTFYPFTTSGGSVLSSMSSATDVALCPDRYSDIYVNYVLMNFFNKEGNYNDGAIAKNNLYEMLYKMKKDYPSKKQVELRRMKHINEFGAAKKSFDLKEDPLQTG